MLALVGSTARDIEYQHWVLHIVGVPEKLAVRDVHVDPPSVVTNKPRSCPSAELLVFACSIAAKSDVGPAGEGAETARLIRPMLAVGKPAPGTLAHVAPWSTDL